MDRVVYALFRVLARVIRALPLETGFRVGSCLGCAAYWVAWRYRRLALRNLGIAFPEKSPSELHRIARDHFRTLGANLLASLKLPTLSREEIEAVVKVEGIETIDAGIAAGRGFVMVVSHLGNWEMFPQLTPYVFRCRVGTVYQPLGNRFLDEAVRRDRARLGFALFDRKEGFTAAARFIRQGGALGVLVDQHAGDAGLWCPFFDRLASTSTLAATLALRTGAWLVPAALYTDGVARWRCVIGEPIEPRGDDAAAITARINATLEEQIRVQPPDWFWVHNRWKTPKPKFLLATCKRGIENSGASRGLRELQPFRIVIRSSNWLGDAVMSIPAVRAIKAGRPDTHVTILAPAKLADLWRAVPAVDAVLEVAPDESVFAVARRLRGRFEAAIIFPNSLRSALEPWLARIPRRVGYPGHRRAGLLNQVLRTKRAKSAPARPPRHQMEHDLALAEFVGAKIDGAFTPASSARPALPRAPVLALCPGAEYGPAKRWLPDRFAETMRIVHERTGCEWRVFGVAGDRELAELIMKSAGVPASDFVGKTTLAELIERVRECDLLVTNDSGTMHLAAFLGVPVVAIFGSTEPALTGPTGTGHAVLRHHVECSPCFLRECPIDFRCMRAIETATVVAAIERALQARSVDADAFKPQA